MGVAISYDKALHLSAVSLASLASEKYQHTEGFYE